MFRLLFTLSFLLWITSVFGQSPHGTGLKIDCSDCHTTIGWKFDSKSALFNHDSVNYKLVGQHQSVDCKSCHKSLDFSTAKSECISCHHDPHENTLGPECAKCHTPKSWIVEDISELHRQGRFPLTGSHLNGDCKLCHKSGSTRIFEPLGIECIDCHRQNYLATSKPNHQQAGYIEDCIQCHAASSATWETKIIDHSFFPLTGGHEVSCLLCHVSGEYSKVPADCFSCHESKYNSTTIPNHQQNGIATNCADCHTPNPKWQPAKYPQHDDQFFPVFSGAHANTWSNCAECHNQSGDFTKYTCVDCHDHSKTLMDDGHKKANGYIYNSIACYTCHTNGTTADGFNHASTNFQLTGAHQGADCLSCHSKGFAGTAMDCYSCHKAVFDGAPLHNSIGISIACETCHTTELWVPSTFDHKNTGFELTGGHSKVKLCSECHYGKVQDAKAECISCHQVQYDVAPNHKTKAYPLDCKICHNFDSWGNALFDHSLLNFPLTGAHAKAECAKCHAKGYTGTPTECNACHSDNYTAAKNPSHTNAGLPLTCATCHTTNAWQPSTFDHAVTGFALTGGHSRDLRCSDCHLGSVADTKSDCISCHQIQYDGAKDHKTQQYPLNCLICHNPDNWLNPQFNHSATNFPLTGVHLTTECAKCHTTGFAGTPADCNACHSAKYIDSQNPNHLAAGLSLQCETCHTPAPVDLSDWVVLFKMIICFWKTKQTGCADKTFIPEQIIATGHTIVWID